MINVLQMNSYISLNMSLNPKEGSAWYLNLIDSATENQAETENQSETQQYHYQCKPVGHHATFLTAISYSLKKKIDKKKNH